MDDIDIKNMKKRPLCAFTICFITLMSILVIIDYYGILKMPWLFKESVIEHIVDDAQVTLVGTVYRYEIKNDNLLIYLKNVNLKNESKIYSMSKVLIYNSLENQINNHSKNLTKNKKELAVGNEIKVRGNINKFKVASNYGEFDLAKYYKSLGIETSIYATNVEVVNDKANEYIEFLYSIKEKLSNNIDMVVKEETAGIVKAMLLGEKQDLTNDVKVLYQKAGASHLIAISGLHLSIVGLSIYRLLRKGGIRYLYAGMLGIIFVISYGNMTGLAISTKRAVIMCVLMIGAGILGRTYDMLTSLAIAALIMMIDNPYCIFNMGFLLSFGAVLGIGVLFPILNQFFEKYIKYRQNAEDGIIKEDKFLNKYGKKVVTILVQGLISGISINLITFPIVLSSFYEFPLYSIILNVLIIPIVGIVLYSGTASMLLTFIWSELGKIAIGVGVLVLEIYEFLFKIIEKLPYSTIILGKPSWWQIILYYLGLYLLVLWVKNEQISFLTKVNKDSKVMSKKDIELVANSNEEYQSLLKASYQAQKKEYYNFKQKVRRFLIGCVAMVVMLTLKLEAGLNITMLDIGQGDCLVIRTADKVTIMIDSGSTDEKQIGKYKVLPFLKAKGYKHLDYFILTHPDEDHISGLKEIIESDYKIKCLIMPEINVNDEKYDELLEMAKLDGIKISYMRKGNVLKNKKLELLCIHPYKHYEPSSRNDYSTSISLNYGDFSMIFTGDIENKGEEEITKILKNINNKYDVLKVAHHGSKNSTSMDFLNVVNPKVAIISAGKDNRYGHPHMEVLERLGEKNCKIYKTFESGAININICNNKITVNEFLNDRE